MSESSSSSSGGIGVLGLLGCIFVTLKLCGVISWSWWWVTAPFWGGFALVLAILFGGLLIAGFVTGIAALCGAIFSSKKTRKRNTLRRR